MCSLVPENRLETTSKYFMADVTGKSQKVDSIVGNDLLLW